MKKSFLNFPCPPLVAMIQCRTPQQCKDKIRASLQAGADAFGIQLCQLERPYRTEAVLSDIFACCGDKPIYITSYRVGLSEGMTDGECADLLLLGLRCGATLCDVIGDLFDDNGRQITTDPAAVEKQKALIDTVHQHGGEVLISTHDFRELSGEELFEVAALQAAHGADVIKIVVQSQTADILPDYLAAVRRIKTELHKPVLLLDSGACAGVLRKVGPDLGTCMYLCVESHNELDTPAQPVLKCLKQLRDYMRA